MAKSKATRRSKDYAAIASKEAKLKAIKAAKDRGELDKMWAAWEAQGWSKDGLLYAALLARKRELGAKLGEGDLERIELAAERLAAAADLPPISANLNLGG